ncbi:MAG: flagellin [Kiritimatiellia bacterium]|jgi:flagellin
MPLMINTNSTSLGAVNNLGTTNRTLSQTFERVSSGLRINRAADDAAGLAVAETFDAEKRSGYQAMRNTNDGISAIQIAEGASNEIGGILKRMRELAVQGSSDLIIAPERNYLTTEYNELRDEVTRITDVTNFNGVSLIDGSNNTITVQVGVGTTNDTIDLTTADLDATALGINALNFSDSTNSSTAIDTIDAALGTVNTVRAGFGASQNRLSSALRSMETYVTNIASAESQIRDADFAVETANMSKLNIMQSAAMAVVGQANNMNGGVVRLIG